MDALLLFLFSSFALSGATPVSQTTPVDTQALAQCITEANFTMYGAEWCKHCKAQKVLFGSSFDQIAYVECTQAKQACEDADIQAYPTRVGPDYYESGVKTLQELADVTNCSLETK